MEMKNRPAPPQMSLVSNTVVFFHFHELLEKE